MVSSSFTVSLCISDLCAEELRDGLKFVFSPDIILSGRLDSKHQLTNHLAFAVDSLSVTETSRLKSDFLQKPFVVYGHNRDNIFGDLHKLPQMWLITAYFLEVRSCHIASIAHTAR